ncbi:hypothetical protein P1P75_37510 [Streptomyces sp. ID05-39B]|uniref:hypothetical protein n=1 Tax=Streptomyces sp. ID05-39B TaxID=3028664 RepID=UPI0029A12A3F|nr:hypothetical protein [Streptomyces sp. ID05-39B]MDX3531947.1 hypothetical protein [Streptomyces sp. ID05-39B]
MPKNRSSRSQKLARQSKARASRAVPPMPRLVASPLEARTVLEQVAGTGHFALIDSNGQRQQVTMRHIRDWHNASLTADGQPPLEPGELAEILMHDFMFGRLRLRTDGPWESDDDYLTPGGQA